MNKADLRKRMKAHLADLPLELFAEASTSICRSLGKCGGLDDVNSIGLYLGLPREISPEALLPDLYDRGIKVAVPVFDAERNVYRMAALHPGAKLHSGPFGIREPVSIEWAEELEVLLVPGLAFGPMGERLGRGCGFYDRIASAHPNAVRTGLCLECQRENSIPEEDHDLRVQALATEQNYYTLTHNYERLRAMKPKGFPHHGE